MSCPAPSAPEFDTWLKGLNMRKLKEFITARGLSFTDCLEKSEFRARAREAAALPATTPGSQGGGANQTTRNPSGNNTLVKRMKTYSGYECEVHAPAAVHEGKEQAAMVVLFLHGYGATADNVSVIAEMCSKGSLQGLACCWVFPQAPQTPSAWWTIDVMGFMMARANPETMAKIIRQPHPGLPECRERMTQLAEQVLKDVGATHNQLIMGGFSQGAMTATDCALSFPADKRPAGILCVSGAPIVIEEWAKKAPTHKGLPVLITHGKADQMLFFQGSVWLKDLLKQGGLDVEHFAHSGGHDFGDPSPILRFVEKVAAGLAN